MTHPFRVVSGVVVPRTTRRPHRPLAALGAVIGVCALAAAPAVPALAAVVPAPLVDEAPDSPISMSTLGTYESGVFDESASEILKAYGDRLFSVNAAAGSVAVISMADPTAMRPVATIETDGYVANSVSIRSDGLGVIALEDAADKTEPGALLFFDANSATPTALGHVTVGSMPDMVTVSPDGTVAVVANEGEPADDFSSDPEGSVGVVSLPELGTISALVQAYVRLADFHAFEDGNLTDGVRVFGPAPHGDDLPVSRNLEPEYVSVSGQTAYVSLQEANAIAVVDLASATVSDIWSLGAKSWSDNVLDPSDRDPEDAPTISLNSYDNLYGPPMPDGIETYEVDGETYVVAVNEGDAREWGDYVESARVGELGTVSEDTGEPIGYGPVCAEAFTAADLADDRLGRLEVSIESGFDETAGCYDSLYAFGARSFSIYTADGDLVADSGSEFEELAARIAPEYFNTGHDTNELESRSDAKGIEPENVDLGVIGDRTFAFVGWERFGGIAAYDITNPTEPVYAAYLNNRDFSISAADDIEANPDRAEQILSQAGDLGPEGVEFIPAASSPTGDNLVAVGNEVSGTTTLFRIDAPELSPAPTPTSSPSAEPTAEPTTEPTASPTAEPTESSTRLSESAPAHTRRIVVSRSRGIFHSTLPLGSIWPSPHRRP